MDISVSIVIVYFNRIDVIHHTLPPILEVLRKHSAELIIVDNGSLDGSVEAIKEYALNNPDVRCIFNPVNYGVSEGRNIGWRASRGEFILSLDDDIIIDNDVVNELLLFSRENSNSAITSPNIIDSVSGRVLYCSRDGKTSSLFFEAAFMVNKYALHKVGYMDPVLKVAGEGLDYSLRLRRSGFTVSYCNHVCVTHVDRVRSNLDVQFRRKEWLWSFVYVYFKNMRVGIAFIYAFWIFCSHLKSGKNFRFRHVGSLVKTAFLGATAGRGARLRAGDNGIRR